MADRSKKLQILSLLPYGFEETKSFFGATNHMVSLSRNLTKEQGVLPEIPLISKGKCLTKEDKHFVARFFEDDSISRQCPGKKDYISVRDEAGTKQQKRK